VISTVNGNMNNPNTNMTGWAPHGGALMATLAQVNTAQSTANSAVASAASAQSTANSALSAAVTAEANALTGISNAAAAQSTANSAVSAAATAETNAVNAQALANSAATTASNAQNTANSAAAAASNAQTQANTANANAQNAQNTANSAQSNANWANSKGKGWSASSPGSITLSLTGQMLGLSSGTSRISTQSTGNLLVFVTGVIYNVTNPSTVEIVTLTGKWGTGNGPSAGSGATGNSFNTPPFQVGIPQQEYDGIPFTFVGYIANEIGNIWVDLEAYESSISGNTQIQNCNIVVIEIG
jgi:hypothetical protein